MVFEQIAEDLIYNLNQLRKNIGDKVVFLKLDQEDISINIENIDINLMKEVLELYLSRYSGNPDSDSSVIEMFFDNIENINSLTAEELIDYYQVVSAIIIFINNLLNSIKSQKTREFETTDLFLLLETKEGFPIIRSRIVSKIVDNLESLIKIRGDYLGEETKHNILETINYLKQESYGEEIKEIDKILSDIARRVQDYEYYLISKDRAFTIVPSSYVWFEFLIHITYLYDNQISINSLIELYERRVKPSFELSKKWYKNLYDITLCKSELKDEKYRQIIKTIEEVEKHLSLIFESVKQRYPDKIELQEQNLAQNIVFLVEKTEELQKLSKLTEDYKLKGTGIFENFYSILREIFAERETRLVLYDFYNSLNSTLSYLEEYEPDYLTPMDKKVLENKDKFEFFLELIMRYLQDPNKDHIIDIIDYFERNIQPIILEVKQDYIKVEKILEPEKIICISCGYQNEHFEEFCSKCGKKLIKVQSEQKSTIKTVFSKIAKITDPQEIPSYAIVLMNILNNSLSNLENIRTELEKLNIDQTQNEFIPEITNKITAIIEDISFLRDKVSYIINNQISLKELDSIIVEVEPIVNDLDSKIEELYSTIRTLIGS
ncbi:MAG: zinc ribbon domain-containing protein [Candidatus Calescibacterium sp.]|nr:zinc ribbon domain-containing protein [Candidatus Calescibacterium sp.]MCX7972202.1 zinc ribbon domain-containing protein [bacterium]MDW8194892.1 zinc ribbon domain-containing protein [Candidatus Calescibacterium sp.]